jgi:hypothetical protein
MIREVPMDFHSLAAAHLPLTRRSKPGRDREDRYYRSCPDFSTLRLRALTPVAVMAGALVLLLMTLGPA